MGIKGIQKTSLVDYPGKLSTVLFFGGCNFLCGFCHNVDLVCDSGKLNSYSVYDTLKLLKDRSSLVDAVVITGGEPTLFKEIDSFIENIKDIPLLIKIDTNGSNSEVLKKLLGKGLVDYVAIDIKTSPEKYKLAAGVNIEFNKIKETVELVKESGVEYELRTTCVPCYVTLEDFKKIKEETGRVKKYFLQQFVNKATLDPALQECDPYPVGVLDEFKVYVKSFADECEIRGV
ncbi:MAG: anaerobic ribonucleoside-triphosphate reductase activating protein [Spirochaetes bacterium]|nr:anaerobic ribonucleoside-triphosphate reductase activating protein [Spirochaetota bacterium]